LSKKYNVNKNVLEAAKERIKFIFDEFENIIVSISGGKDSTVLAYLALLEANKRGRKIGLFFLDEEVVYQNTAEQIEYVMNLFPANTNRFWLQIPFKLTNSTSFSEGQLNCWEQSEKKKWMRKRKADNILKKTWSHQTKVVNKNKGFGFYDVLYNFELSFLNTAFLVGLRADESFNRYRTMIKNPGYKEVMWSTKRDGGNFTFYPLYDWGFHDIWKFIGENNLKYHKFYDFAYKKGRGINEIRVSSLTHEKSFKSIQDLPEFEFETYEKLVNRIQGIAFAQETAKNKKMFQVKVLPQNFKKWCDYRDFLLKTYPDETKKHIFVARFAKHKNNEYVARQQCKQLILNDYENNFPVKNNEDPIQEKIAYWRSVL